MRSAKAISSNLAKGKRKRNQKKKKKEKQSHKHRDEHGSNEKQNRQIEFSARQDSEEQEERFDPPFIPKRKAAKTAEK